MRYDEVENNLELYDWIEQSQIADNFSIGDYSNSESVGSIKVRSHTNIEELEVFKKEIDDSIVYWVIKNNLPICMVGLQKWQPPLCQAKNAYCEPSERNKGYISALIDFIVNTEKKAIISDFLMSPSGAKSFLKMCKTASSFSCNIIDLKTGKIFKLSDVDSKTSDNEPILYPEDDDRDIPSPGMINKTEPYSINAQRFVYILGEHNMILESFKIGKNIFKVPERKSKFLQEMVYYGQGMI